MTQGTRSVSILANFAVLVLAASSGCGGQQSPRSITPIVPAPANVTYYGSCINADALSNIIVGWGANNTNSNASVSYRIRATHSGQLESVRPFFIWSSSRPGYQSGTGGTIQVQIQADDGSSTHTPSGIPLASTVFSPPVTSADPSSHFPNLTFDSPTEITAGQLYHIVFTNIDPDPQANWVSLDTLWMWSGLQPTQPTVSGTDLAILQRAATLNQGAWAIYDSGRGSSTPVIELDFADGFAQGQGYIQGDGAPDLSFTNPHLISGNQVVRETFTVSGADRTVSAVSVRVNRVSGSSPLNVLVESSTGTAIGQGSVMVPMGGAATAISNGSSWVHVSFSSSLTLKAGASYNLVISSPADTVHTTHVLEKGTNYGFDPQTCFGDGFAQFDDGKGWTGWDLWGLSNLLNTDLQFYFTVVS